MSTSPAAPLPHQQRGGGAWEGEGAAVTVGLEYGPGRPPGDGVSPPCSADPRAAVLACRRAGAGDERPDAGLRQAEDGAGGPDAEEAEAEPQGYPTAAGCREQLVENDAGSDAGDDRTADQRARVAGHDEDHDQGQTDRQGRVAADVRQPLSDQEGDAAGDEDDAADPTAIARSPVVVSRHRAASMV